MKRLNNYQRFFESRKVEILLEEYGILLESDESAAAAPTEVQSEKEILEEMPEDQKSKIEDILAKHFPEAKDELDINKLPSEGGEGESKEGEESEKTNEGAVLLAITIASLIPACMEAVGSLSNLLKQKFSVNLDDKQIANLKKMNDAIAALNKIYSKGSAKFQGKDYNMKTFSEISNILSKELANPELEFGKGYDDGHGHKTNEEAEVSTEDPKNTVKKEISKLKKFRDKIFGSDFGKWMKEKGHALHHAYTAPIRAVLWTISKVSKKSSKLRDENVREKIANIIYSITMVGLAGYGIMSTLSHLNGVGEVAQLILKGTEGGLNLSEIRKQALAQLLG
jgi:hypothetical protein